MRGLAGCFEHAVKGRFAGQLDPFVGQFRHDLVRRHLGMRRFIGDGKQMLALVVTELMARCGATCLGSRIFRPLPPSLHGADAQRQHRAGRRESRTGGHRVIEKSQHFSAI
jgi:hypothetical protein